MSDTAAAQLQRILHLVPQLADDAEHPVDEVVRRLGIDRATLLRDLRALSVRAVPPPGGFIDGVSITLEREQVHVHANHFLRPMRLTEGEVAALDLGLALLRAERTPAEHAAIDAARGNLRRIHAAFPEGEAPPQPDRAAAPAGGDPALLATLRDAAVARRRVTIHYLKADAVTAVARTICPYAVVLASGTWYVVGLCLSVDAVRVFRLDRIREAAPAEGTFAVPDDFSLDALVHEGRIFGNPDAGALRVRYSARIARWIAEREGAEPAADGTLELEHPLADEDWAVRHVLQYGPDAEVLAPPSVRVAVRDRLAAMFAALDD